MNDPRAPKAAASKTRPPQSHQYGVTERDSGVNSVDSADFVEWKEQQEAKSVMRRAVISSVIAGVVINAIAWIGQFLAAHLGVGFTWTK